MGFQFLRLSCFLSCTMQKHSGQRAVHAVQILFCCFDTQCFNAWALGPSEASVAGGGWLFFSRPAAYGNHQFGTIWWI